MAAGVTIKLKRKAGAFTGGQLAAGELGVDVSNDDLYASSDGSDVWQVNGGSGGGVDTANSPNANEFARFTDADTIEGRTVSETKSDLGLENVTNESKATMFTNAALTGNPTAPTPSPGDNDTSIATTAFVKDAVDTAVTGLLEFKGSQDCSGNPNYPAASKGDGYVVSVAGKIGGASGKSVDVGDWYIATADNAGGSEATVGTSWTVLEHNLSGVYVAGGTDVPVTDGGTGASSASGARTNLGLVIGTDVAAFSHSHGAGDITSGDLASARMQANLKAALEAVSQTFNSSNTTIDGGTL